MNKALKVGLTGGIGSGKSTIAKIFMNWGIPIFNADNVAKLLMNTDEELKIALQNAFGEDIYVNGKLQNKILANLVFNNQEKLTLLNNIVHPKTISYGHQWFEERSQYPYLIKEAAILIESGSYKDMDIIIGVTAPEPLRISRTIKRDNTDKESVIARINKQISEEDRLQYCQYIIHNDDKQSIIHQTYSIHQQILSLMK